MIIRDGMEPTLNHADRRVYTSKRAYEKAVKAAGCEIIGSQRYTAPAKPEMDDPTPDIVRAVDKALANTQPKRRKRKSRG
jgi:hypothetical protein